MSRVWIYKQTHNDDPGQTGVFGCADCMGWLRYRAADANAVIGLLNDMPSWVGLNPQQRGLYGRGPLLVFGNFLAAPPAIACPALVEFMQRKRHDTVPLLTYTANRLIIEIRIILEEATHAPPSPGPITTGRCQS